MKGAERATESSLTPYGFRFGAALVERAASQNGYVSVLVKTDGGHYIYVQVSPQGRSVTIQRYDKNGYVATEQMR